MSNLTFTVTLNGPAQKLLEAMTATGTFFTGLGVEVALRVTGSLEINEVLTASPKLAMTIPEFLGGVDEERPRNCLMRAYIKTVGELVEKEEDDLLAITNFGHKSLDTVKSRLAELGLSLKPSRST